MVNSSAWRLRPASLKEINNWNALVAANPDGGNALQTKEFASVKAKEGWQARYCVYEGEDCVLAAVALVRHIPLLGELWYFPKGPGISDTRDLAGLAEANYQYMTQHAPRAFCIKLEPELMTDEIGWRSDFRVSHVIQANTATIHIPLTPDPYMQVNHLGKRARRNIRLGLKDSLELCEVPVREETCRQMYALMKTVAGGRGVAGIRPYGYYRHFWQAFAENGCGRLYFALENGKPVIGAFVLLQGKKATYKDGGSSPYRQSKYASYALQRHVMRTLAKEGYCDYDLCGVPPRVRLDDSSHHLYGVGMFKRAFSKQVDEYCGVYDQIFSRWRYLLWVRAVYPVLRRLARLRGGYFY